MWALSLSYFSATTWYLLLLNTHKGISASHMFVICRTICNQDQDFWSAEMLLLVFPIEPLDWLIY